MAEMEKITDPLLVRLLQQNREEMNHLWANYTYLNRQADPDIFLEMWSDWLKHCGEINSLPPEEDFIIYYRLSLEMFIQYSFRNPVFLDRDIAHFLASILPFQKQDPAFLSGIRKVIDKLLVISLDSTQNWVMNMIGFSSAVSDKKLWQEVGLVQAWLAGMSQYRQEALYILETIPEAIWKQVCPGQSDRRIVEALKQDPWLGLPGYAPRFTTDTLILEGFRGYGGNFTAPPVIIGWEEGLLLRTGELYWICFADAYGVVVVADGRQKEALPPSDTHSGNPDFLADCPAEWPREISSSLNLDGAVWYTSPLSFHLFVQAGNK